MEGSGQDGAGKEEPASGRVPPWGERKNPAAGQWDWEMEDLRETALRAGFAEEE